MQLKLELKALVSPKLRRVDIDTGINREQTTSAVWFWGNLPGIPGLLGGACRTQVNALHYSLLKRGR